MKNRELYWPFWGKTGKEPEEWHPLIFHALDVAAVGVTLLAKNHRWHNTLGRLSSIPGEPLSNFIAFFLSIHDMGKFCDSFQGMKPDLMQRLQQRSHNNKIKPQRHDLLGYRLWHEVVGEQRMKKWSKSAADMDEEDLQAYLEPWISAVTGHHGRPPKPEINGDGYALTMITAPESLAAAKAYVDALEKQFLPNGLPFSLVWSEEQLNGFKQSAWLLAGLAVASDWIASNNRWFPYCSTSHSLKEYWLQRAVPQAKIAVQESGLSAAACAELKPLTQLYAGRIQQPTPLQQQAAIQPLIEGPQLLIIEEATGGGKTEAAILLSHRLMSMGVADGFFFALPTMATANAMVRRIEAVGRGLFAAESDPVLVLAHSAQHLMEKVLLSGADYGQEEPSSESTASAWLQDHRKKALLAHLGVGTIDQALLGILPAKHQSLRLLGLLGKVLIVDEVHASDPYMHRLLRTLLTFHAAFGGSAILLSATLPYGMRQQLTDAFAEGGQMERPQLQKTDYPLLTSLSQKGLLETPVASRSHKQVNTQLIFDEPQLMAHIQKALDKGGAVCWIRNTVVDALTAYEQWLPRLGKERLTLFHARFALGDRLNIEKDVVNRFGKESQAFERQGQLLIATQVVEQSLDLDFDAMVTDLAPADLLIQRAGRLHRHWRGERDRPVLTVYLPKPESKPKADWYSRCFPNAAYVYPFHGQLWLTARWLQQKGGFAMPEDARSWVESVYGEAAMDHLPEVLKKVDLSAEGKEYAQSEIARQNALKLMEGYAPDSLSWMSGENAPTRLSEPTIMVRLARWQGGELQPWCEDENHPWSLSQLSMRRALVTQESPNWFSELEAAKRKMPDQGKYAVVVILTAEESMDKWRGEALNGKGRLVPLTYSPTTGLTIQKAGDV